MQIIGGGFGSLDRQPMHEIAFGVIACRLEFIEALGGFLTDGHNLKSHHIHLAGFSGSEIIGKAQMIVIGLAREGKARQYIGRGRVDRIRDYR